MGGKMPTVTLSTLLTDATTHLTAAGISAADARTEARMLVQHAFGLTREQLLLRSEVELDAALLEPFLLRRASREPLTYILGERGFYGLSFRVTPAVLIPRPETEHLVEVALAFLFTSLGSLGLATPSGFAKEVSYSDETSGASYPLRSEERAISRTQRVPRSRAVERGEVNKSGGERQVLDIGTGSGCIAVTLAKLLPEAQVWATDISEAALEVARENATRHGVHVEFHLGDLLAPLPLDLCFNVIVSNPPYIAPSEASTLEPEVRDFEPHTALFDNTLDGEGLSFYRRLADEAPARLVPGGLLAVEVGQGQAEAVARLWRDAGLVEVSITPDLAGIGRVVSGNKP